VKTNETLLVVVSDLHCGSTVALCPPEYPMLDDGEWGLNAIQRWIWDRWTSFGHWVEDYARGRPYVLLVNGDAIEGVHHGTKEVVHADTGVHVSIAVDCLRPLASKASRTYVVRGTGAHVGHSAEHAIGRAIGAVDADGVYSRHHWLFRVGPTVVSAKHHIGTSVRRSLRGTQLSIHLEEERAECAAAGYQVPDLVIRSHRHCYGHYQTEDAQIVVTPAWQALTGFGWKVVPNAIPTIGGVILDWSLTGAPVPIPYTARPPRGDTV
jgi:hypothetical protein